MCVWSIDNANTQKLSWPWRRSRALHFTFICMRFLQSAHSLVCWQDICIYMGSTRNGKLKDLDSSFPFPLYNSWRERPEKPVDFQAAHVRHPGCFSPPCIEICRFGCNFHQNRRVGVQAKPSHWMPNVKDFLAYPILSSRQLSVKALRKFAIINPLCKAVLYQDVRTGMTDHRLDM